MATDDKPRPTPKGRDTRTAGQMGYTRQMVEGTPSPFADTSHLDEGYRPDRPPPPSYGGTPMPSGYVRGQAMPSGEPFAMRGVPGGTSSPYAPSPTGAPYANFPVGEGAGGRTSPAINPWAVNFGDEEYRRMNQSSWDRQLAQQQVRNDAARRGWPVEPPGRRLYPESKFGGGAR